MKWQGVQAKLAVAEPHDNYEQEAERIAGQVTAPSGPAPEQRSAPRIQRRPAAGTGNAPASVESVLGQPGRALDAGLRQDLEQRFGHDFSRVRVHADTAAQQSAAELSAEAYTVGDHVVFGHAHFAPETAAGRRLLAHELTHVVQQRGGASVTAAPPGVVSRRRVPASVGLQSSVPVSGPGLSAARTGVARVLSRAWAGLSAAQQAAVKTAAAPFTWTDEADLLGKLSAEPRAKLVAFAQLIRTTVPAAELGDPLLIDVGPRPGTADAANLSTLTTNANTIFTAIAGGGKDTDLTEVFGSANVATAKTKYANAKTRMNALLASDKIVSDRSGYSAEVGLGGLSNAAQISVMPQTIDNPSDKDSVVTIIHESMHAGNSDVRDFGYITQPSFTALAEAVKLTNAAHFEVVPRRILGASHAFTGVTFIPAGTTVGGVTAPALTPREQAVRAASETFRFAWTVGLNLHKLFLRVFRTPSEWSTLDLSTAFSGAPAGAHWADTLPFWSKVELLTVHDRTAAINPAGLPAVQPVTLVDLALSEGLIRRLVLGMRQVPQTEADALAFENASATPAEKTAAAASVNAERDLLIRLVLRVRVGSITGAVSRDERVVARLAQAGTAPGFSDILAVRPPSVFP